MIRATFSLLMCFGYLTQASASGLSAATNGVYLAIIGWRGGVGAITNDPIRVDDRLVFMTFCNTGKAELYRPLNPAYGVKVKMYDEDGKEVSKTASGENFGSKFDRLQSYRDTRLGIETAWGGYKDNPELGGGKPLPTPKELFQIKKHGVYTMEIEMQMFRFVAKGTNQVAELFRFSPVKIKVEKPLDDKPHKP